MISNYQILQFLAKDGGYYTLRQHLDRLRAEYPDEIISLSQVDTLRKAMRSSPFIHADFRKAEKGRSDAIRVLKVDNGFRSYSKPFTQAPRPTYLVGEPEEVMTAVRLGMMFDKLLSQARSRHGCTN